MNTSILILILKLSIGVRKISFNVIHNWFEISENIDELLLSLSSTINIFRCVTKYLTEFTKV